MLKAELIASRFAKCQQEICSVLEEADGSKSFFHDRWSKPLGNGVTSVLQHGNAIEKGGVNFSFVSGDFTPKMELLLAEKANRYAATGISSIMHPVNPFAPIIHANVRYFALDNGTEWFGGGIDLTPHFINPEEAKWFHNELKTICNRYDIEFYPKFKAWADDYFFIPHRNETRGIGGIFFDRIKPNSKLSLDKLTDFTLELAQAYPKIYATLLKANKNKPFTAQHKEWQELRRGRYVEFNLVYDRGTKFGFESGGNTESILVSLPTTASWEYKHAPAPNSDEQKTLDLLVKGINW